MNNNIRRGRTGSALLIVAFAIVLYAVFQNPEVFLRIFGWIWGVISPVVLGMCIAFVMNVLLIYVEKGLGFISRGRLKAGIIRPVGILITVVAMIGAVALVLGVILPSIGETVAQIAGYLPKSEDSAFMWISEKLAALGFGADTVATIVTKLNDIIIQVGDFLEREYMEIANIAINATTSILDVIMGIVVSLIFAIYVLASKEKIGRFCTDALRRFVKPKWADRVINVCHLSFESFTSFVKGQLLEACILGVLCFIGMVIFGFPYAPVASLIIGVTALIPIFGAWIGAGISALLILIVSPLDALLFLVFILVLQELEGNLIYPRVVGQSMGLPGLLVLAAITVGGNIAGIVGMLLGVPVCSVMYTLLRRAVYGLHRDGIENTQE